MNRDQIQGLRYPFHSGSLRQLLSKIRWKLNELKDSCLPLLNAAGAWLTIIDGFGAPGDTVLTATVIRNLRLRFPRLKVNCITANPDLLRFDPHIDTLNKPEGFFSSTFSYFDLKARKDGATNVLVGTLGRLGIRKFQYAAQLFLTTSEVASAIEALAALPQPIITINCHSKEPVKNWPVSRWRELVERCAQIGSVVQLGDSSEPHFPNVTRFAGELTMRQSAAILAQSSVHIGPDSFLTHVANGVRVRSVVIFGGAHTPATLGYEGNINLYRKMPCSPCWIQANDGESCTHDIRCLREISVDEVFRGVVETLAGRAERVKAHA